MKLKKHDTPKPTESPEQLLARFEKRIKQLTARKDELQGWFDEYLKLEQDDAIAIIEWAAQQPWCNGNVGMTGLSWGGFASLQVAARRPKSLKAIISIGATVDRYNDDIHYKNGCLLNENFGWGTSLTAFTTRPPDPLTVGEKWRSIWLNRLENLDFRAKASACFRPPSARNRATASSCASVRRRVRFRSPHASVRVASRRQG